MTLSTIIIEGRYQKHLGVAKVDFFFLNGPTSVRMRTEANAQKLQGK